MRITRNLGFLLLAIWLILEGLLYFVPSLSALGIILAVIAIVAGVLILVER
jgi:hypothetical protein